MTEFIFFFLIFILLAVFWTKPKELPMDKPLKEPLDISKNSDWYLKEYPEILKPEPPEPQNPTIIVNVTNNHLHIHITPEETQPR